MNDAPEDDGTLFGLLGIRPDADGKLPGIRVTGPQPTMAEMAAEMERRAVELVNRPSPRPGRVLSVTFPEPEYPPAADGPAPRPHHASADDRQEYRGPRFVLGAFDTSVCSVASLAEILPVTCEEAEREEQLAAGWDWQTAEWAEARARRRRG